MFCVVTVERVHVLCCDSGTRSWDILKNIGLEHIFISQWQLSAFVVIVLDNGILMNCIRIQNEYNDVWYRHIYGSDGGWRGVEIVIFMNGIPNILDDLIVSIFRTFLT